MKILYIDTSSNYLYAGISKDKELLIEKKIAFNHDLSKYALNEIDKMFKESNLEPKDIDKIIVVSGPGSFTGIRIGMTFAKIYAWSFKKEITTITSLEAMNLSYQTNKLKVPIIDARRGFVYAGIYENENTIMENCYIKLTDLQSKLEKMNKEYVFITNDKFDLNNLIPYNPDILNIILKFRDKTAINPHLVEPEYLKLTEAEENLRDNKNDN